MLYSTAVFWCAMLRFLAHPKEVFGYKPNSRRGCQNNREELGFALVGHDFKSVHADNFARCYFKCSLEERCQSVTFLWSKKECQMKKETKKSRPGDFVENPAATYMENNFRGLSFQLFLFCKKESGWIFRLTSTHLTMNRRPITIYVHSCKDDFCKEKRLKGELWIMTVPGLSPSPLDDGMFVHCAGLLLKINLSGTCLQR